MKDKLKFYINGQWVESESNEKIEVINPANESVVGHVTAGTKEDINRAVEAALNAFSTYQFSSKEDRIELLNNVIAEYENRYQDFVDTITEEMGAPLWLSSKAQASTGIKNLNEYYNSRSIKKYENIKLISENNNSDKFPFCPIILGINFLDQIKTLEKLNKIKFDKISYPLLILPFLSRASEIIGKKINLKFDQYEFLLNLNNNILSNLFNKEYPIISNITEVSILENEDNFTDKEWKNLYKLSEKIFVEETESLKQGAAGAGLTDND